MHERFYRYSRGRWQAESDIRRWVRDRARLLSLSNLHALLLGGQTLRRDDGGRVRLIRMLGLGVRGLGMDERLRTVVNGGGDGG